MLNRIMLSFVVMFATLMLTVAPLYAQRPPSSTPLTAVSHDATLTGDGTSGSPLSVVSPYTGVVHDSSLAGNGTAASPLRVVPQATAIAPLTVVDATGKTVGRYGAGTGFSGLPDLVYVKINDQLVVSPLGHRDNTFASGLDFAQLPVYYQTADCTGTAYIDGLFAETFSVRHAVLAKVGGLDGQVVAYVASGSEWRPAADMSFSSSQRWNGTNYQCFTEQAVATAFPTSEIDVTGMFTAPLVIQ
jgi:hypothetical protein